MENDREVDSVMMNIRSTSGSILSAALFSARMTYKLMSFLFRLAKKGLVSAGAADRFLAFSNQTGGKYTAYNIPLSAENVKVMQELNKLELRLEQAKNPIEKGSLRREIEKLQKSIPEVEQLKRLGINFCVLPKLNGSEQTIQIAVSNENEQLFKNWFGNHLTAAMSSGGEKNLESIKVFTEGNYTILNMPFEKTEELEDMMSDFNTLGVNYAVLPDLNVGDGYTQVAVPNANRNQVEQWFRLWKERALANGEEPKDMFSVSESSYLNTAEINADKYINTADSPFQEVQAEYEKESSPVAWAAGPGKENSEAFVRLDQDDRYEKITINKEKLVDYQQADFEAYKQQGLFASRFPGTQKEGEKTLLVPMDKVFSTDDGKTYIAFLDKTAGHPVLERDGTQSIKNVEELKKTYADVNRGFQKVEAMQKDKIPTKTANVKPPKLDFKF